MHTKLNDFPSFLLVARASFRSGVLNFCAVSLALFQLGYQPIGCRIDSGDLAYLSRTIYDHFCKIKEAYQIEQFVKQDIIASGDIDEETIYSLNEQGHKLTCFGIGTKLVTCQKQSALGAVYKVRFIFFDVAPLVQ